MILFVIFIPVFFASLFTSFFMNLFLTAMDPEHIPKNWGSLVSTTSILYKAYMKYLWVKLAITAIVIDIYFYVLKGYRKNELVFYGLKSLFIFIILYFATFVYFEDSFGILQSFNLGKLPTCSYIILLIIGIFFSVFCMFSVYLFHKNWIFPYYQKKHSS